MRTFSFLLVGLSGSSEVVLAPKCERALEACKASFDLIEMMIDVTDPEGMGALRTSLVPQINEKRGACVARLRNDCFGDDLAAALARMTEFIGVIEHQLSAGETQIRSHLNY